LPHLFGAAGGAFNLTGLTNAQVAALAKRLGRPAAPRLRRLKADVLAAALSVYATTLPLGGTAGQAFGLAVTATGLGALSFPVRRSGAAFGVANHTRLNVYQLLQAVDKKAAQGVPYGGRARLQAQAIDLLEALNRAGTIG
jgi:hypothetical protein